MINLHLSGVGIYGDDQGISNANRMEDPDISIVGSNGTDGVNKAENSDINIASVNKADRAKNLITDTAGADGAKDPDIGTINVDREKNLNISTADIEKDRR